MEGISKISVIYLAAIATLCLFHVTGAQEQYTRVGKCPAAIRRPCSTPKERDECFFDSDCTEKQKCCDDACGVFKCTDPVIPLPKCNIAVDLGIVVDASTSITPNNFNKMKSFLKNLVNEFDVREGGTHVAAIVFGDQPRLVFDFNELRDSALTRDNVATKIGRIPQISGANRIDLALAKANMDVFSLNGGMRKNAPRILIMLTDGLSNVNTNNKYSLPSLLQEANKLKDNGVQLFIVAVGSDVDLSNLNSIASGGRKVFHYKTFDMLRDVPQEIAVRSCKACTDAVDIAFAIPSNSFGQFEDLRDFIKSALDYFILGPKNVQVSLLSYNTDSEILVKFDQEHNLRQLKQTIDDIPYLRRGSSNRLDMLLQKAANDVFTLRNGVRQGAAKKLVIISEAQMTGVVEDISKAVKQLEFLGVDIVGVAYGRNADKGMLKRISSFPQADNYKEAPSITDMLSRIPRALVESSCKTKKGKCPYNALPSNCPPNAERFYQCRVDQDCPEGGKCCQVDCYRRCTPPVQGCSRAFEIAFLVDTSYHVSDEELHRVKSFITEMANSFGISETGTRFSIVAYSLNAEVALRFSDNFNTAHVINEIGKLNRVITPERRLDLGLQKVHSDVFSLKAGIRQGVPHILIVLSGGPPSASLDRIQDIASSLKQHVNVWAVGSGPSVSTQYLNEIASNDQQSQKTLLFENLGPLVSEITNKICSDKPGQCPKPVERFCLVQNDECINDYECPGFSKCCHDGCRKTCLPTSWECKKPLDLAIVMESSGNVGENNYKVVKTFVKDLVKALNVDKSKTEIAILAYAGFVNRLLTFSKLKDIYNKEINILRTIDRAEYTGGANDAAHKALAQAHSYVFDRTGGSRDNAVKGLIFITAGLPSGNIQKIIQESTILKQRGVAIYTVSASRHPNLKALEVIASETSNEHIFLATSLPAIIQYVHQLSQEACKAEAPPRQVRVIKGPKGEPGELGEPGESGPAGTPGAPGGLGGYGPEGGAGAPGVPGNPGRPGKSGNPGPPGPRGPLYIHMSRQDGAGQIRSVTLPPFGAAGPRGYDGGRGEKGSRGPPGKSGPTGENGMDGMPGYTGRRGKMGSRGKKGESGIPGRAGRRGPRGDQGETGGLGGPGRTPPKGEKGPIGDQGYRGIHGDRGDRGLPGLSGKSGLRGLKGARGRPGEMGKKGTLAPTGPRGIKGSEGDIGPKGDRGNLGAVGVMGKKGKKGTYGPHGPPGHRGVPGETGSPGHAGTNGSPAADGKKGFKGKIGAKGSVGDPGPLGISGQSGVTAPQGEPGQSGPSGYKGKRGSPGKAGVKGPLGDKGSVGNFGAPGIDGNTGPKGKKGTVGDVGSAGPRGTEGPRGIQGSRGYVGIDGPPGIQGKNGARGKSGKTGRIGARGRIGKRGGRGAAGKSGSKGRTGRPGKDGKYGPLGAPGDHGHMGPTGEQGSKGYIGVKGQMGDKGSSGPQGLIGLPGPLGGQGLKGKKGREGEKGQAGFAGTPGEQGPRGAGGDHGVPGAQGAMGAKGPAGDQGHEGEKGPLGNEGLKGEDGAKGESGAKGDTGAIGEAGVDGVLGVVGERGQPGVMGRQGTAGFPGTSGEPGAAGVVGQKGISGPEGDKGGKGDAGIAGGIGVPGADGDHGVNGVNGPAGLPGKDGAQGDDGIPGVVGEPGSMGATGRKGEPGEAGPAGEPGVGGLAGPRGGRGETGPRGLKGDPGIVGGVGMRGYDGKQGEPGPAGLSGERGERGLQGQRGTEGPMGPSGFPGPMGARGDQGRAGEEGVVGENGPVGDTGEVGKTGDIGTKGESGEKGDAGEDGDKGGKGAIGLPGSTGVSGPRGVPGDMGFLGYDGRVGAQGRSGRPGVHGKPGKNGGYGERGEKGFDGPRGGYGETGPKGAGAKVGEKGDPGGIGYKGPKGDSGPAGTEGAPGKRGMLGSPGISGLKGVPGEKGNPGPVGLTGVLGPRGDRGPKGRRGHDGSKGESGIKGSLGDPGPVGFAGPKGKMGVKGNNGIAGTFGEKGFVGDLGPPGPSGKPGVVGEVGPVGLNGIHGPEGDSGPKGPQGRRGPPGPPGQPGGPRDRGSSSADSGDSDKPPSYYHAFKKRPLFEEDIFGDNFELLKIFNQVSKDLSSFQKPLGTKKSPALTCGDLFNDNSHLENGDYWLDPNGGAPEDAVLVHCNFKLGSSCISPLIAKTEIKQWFHGDDRYLWFKDDIDENFKFRYSVESSQLTFLQLLSNQVSQTITYYCVRSNAWRNETGDVTHSIKLLGDNEREYMATTARKQRPIVHEDGCKEKDGEERKTVIEVATVKTARLPIRDIAVYDGGDSGEKFGLEIGPVCFS